jgi:threonyl-tRNA synthetase
MFIYVQTQDSQSPVKLEMKDGATGLDLVDQLKRNMPNQSLGMIIDGTLLDLAVPLSPESIVTLVDFENAKGKEMFWHTSAHILAQAVLRLFPEAIPTIGPPIEEGFWYDFANLTITLEDLARIEEEADKIIKANYKTQRVLLQSKEEALEAFGTNAFKREIIENLEEGLTGYRQGEFYDLCRGPHIPNLAKVKAFKILKTSGSYWRGDATKPTLTRLYGISFPDRKLLQEYLTQKEEAKKRDHKIIGPKLDLFSLRDEAPGLPFIHPKGMKVWNSLIDFWREKHQNANYHEIKTPSIMTRELWEISGHWDNYRHNMYTLSIEERDFAVKPMNCPGCIIFYKMEHHSYREFPLRISELGHVHRFEASGALSGLMRVRGFHQDDAHIFLTQDMIEEEVHRVLQLLDDIYQTFGLSYHLELSTRPETNTIGSDEDWEIATNGLKNALDRMQRVYKINHGDGAFYGPKIDIHIRDCIGRTWQCGTIQLDMALPERFDLEYTAADGNRKRPVMIHRALFGSIERFFGILIEHFVGRFPLWLSPQHVRILPVADRHVERASVLLEQLRKSGFYADIDDSHDSVSKKVRNAQVAQINYMITVGDKEVEDGTISLRTRENQVFNAVSFDCFLENIRQERDTRSLISPYSTSACSSKKESEEACQKPYTHIEKHHGRDCC